MAKVRYHSKLHRKYKQSLRNNKESSNNQLLSNKNSLRRWWWFQYILDGFKYIPITISRTTKLILKSFQYFSSNFLNSQSKIETSSSFLEARVQHLESLLQECTEKINTLQTKVELTAKTEQATVQNAMPAVCLNSAVPPPPPFVASSAAPPPPPLPPPLLPPPPLPPPLLPPLSGNKPVQLRVPKNDNRPSKPAVMRPSISVEDLLSVKLKKTPSALKIEKVRALTPANELLPRISLEALRSVKLKRTSLGNHESTDKSKSPKSKTCHRAILRRMPYMLRSPGGTPKMVDSRLISTPDEMTPELTKALQNRFRAFHMSPEDDKENDMQYE